MKIILKGANKIFRRATVINFRGRQVKNRAQSILEYVIIISVVAAAVVAMQTYFRRAVNGRLEEIKQEYAPKAP